MHRAFACGLLASTLLICAWGQGAKTASFTSARAGFYEVKVAYPVFTGPAKALNAGLKAEAKKAYDSFLAECAKTFKGNRRPTAPWSLHRTVAFGMISGRIASFVLTESRYSGGAHPTTNVYPRTYAARNGTWKILDVNDVLLRQFDKQHFLLTVVAPKLAALKRARRAGELEGIDIDRMSRFLTTPEGMTWMTSDYEVGSYAEGRYVVKLNWFELRAHIDEHGPLGHLLPAGERNLRLFGVASFRERMALPAGAELRVSVRRLNAARTEPPLASLSIPAKNGETPFDVRIKFKDARGHREYSVHVEIVAGGKTLFAGVTPLTSGVSGWAESKRVLLVRMPG